METRKDPLPQSSIPPVERTAPGGFFIFGGRVAIIRRALRNPANDDDGPALRPTKGPWVPRVVVEDFEESLDGGYFVTELIPDVSDSGEQALTREEYERLRG